MGANIFKISVVLGCFCLFVILVLATEFFNHYTNKKEEKRNKNAK